MAVCKIRPSLSLLVHNNHKHEGNKTNYLYQLPLCVGLTPRIAQPICLHATAVPHATALTLLSAYTGYSSTRLMTPLRRDPNFSS